MHLQKKGFMILFAMILATVLALSGCGNASTGSGQATSGKSAASDNSAGGTKAGSGQSSDNKIVSLKYLGTTDKFDPTKDFTRENIKKLLGVNIIPSMGSNQNDKVNLILSSGQDYDMIMMNANQRNLLASYIKNGAIQPLNAAIDKYGPNLKKEIPQKVWDMVSSNGKIYAIPTTNYEAVTGGIVIREDWLKKLNLPLPKTVDQFYNTLKAFKEKDPGGVGSKLIPFSADGADSSGIGMNGLSQAFGIGATPTSIVEKNGKLVSGMETNGLKDYVTYLNKLYAQGLLDPDFPALKKSQLVQKIGSGVVGAATLSCWDSGAQKALQAKDPNAKLVFLPPLTGKDNATPKIENTGGLYQFMIVPKTSKKVNQVVKYANDFLDPNNYSKLILGEKGVSYKVENGKYYPIFPAFNKYNKGRWFYPVNVAKMYTPLFGARAHKEKEMGEMWDDINAKAGKYSYENIVNFAPMMPSVEQYGQKLDLLVADPLMKMVLDKKRLSGFDSLVQEWKQKGGDAITKDYNNWYKNRSK